MTFLSLVWTGNIDKRVLGEVRDLDNPLRQLTQLDLMTYDAQIAWQWMANAQTDVQLCHLSEPQLKINFSQYVGDFFDLNRLQFLLKQEAKFVLLQHLDVANR